MNYSLLDNNLKRNQLARKLNFPFKWQITR